MPKKVDDEWLPDARGRYRRKVGWWISDTDQRKQYPFSFGTNKDQAKARLARVRELWAEIVKQHKEPSAQVGFPPLPPDSDNGKPDDPVWTSEALWIAKELAAGNVQIPVGAVPDIRDEVYAQKLQRLAKKYPFVSFVAEDRERYEAGSAFLDRGANHQLSELERRHPEALQEHTQVRKRKTGTLHAALNAYIAHVRNSDVDPTPDGPTLSQFGAHKISNAEMLRLHHKDRPLDFDLDDCQALIDAAPEDVVEQPMQQYTPLNKRERIVALKKEGLNVSQIMEEVGVSRMTVLRTLEKLYYRPKKTKQA